MDLKNLWVGPKWTDMYEVQLNANHYGDFKASEIAVSVVDGAMEITGKQVWRPHPGGSHRREFVHRLNLPADVNADLMTAYMARDGNVIVRAPRFSGPRRIGTDLPMMSGGDKSVGGMTQICMQ